MGEFVRIVPVQGEGPMHTRGTKVMVGDRALKGVQKIVLTAEVNDLWRAEIHCIGARFDHLEATATMHMPNAWQLLKGRIVDAACRARGYCWIAKRWILRRWKFGAFEP